MLAAIRNFLIQKVKELYWEATRAVGLEHLHGKSFTALASGCRHRIAHHLYALAAFALRRANVHFINPPTLQLERIGHFAVDIDSYLKERILQGRKFRAVLICTGKPNEALLAHWSRHVKVIRNIRIIRMLEPLMDFPGLSTRMREYGMVSWQAWDSRLPFEARLGASPIYDIQGRWAKRPPLLHLSKSEVMAGEAVLRKLGLPKDAWFVCVHVREGGYSPTDDWSHSYRNANIESYFDAMKAIVARGGWCIRVGDPTMRPLPPMPGVVDYALTDLKNDATDIFLCASCRFFLGSTSGLFTVAGIFGRPSALTNLTSMSCSYSFFPNDLSIIKLVADMQDRLVPWPDIFNSQAADLRLTPEFAERGLKNLDNSPREITELAIEMMDQIDNRVIYDANDEELQERFRALVKPHHYCWGAASRMGRSFLRQHRELFDT